MIYEFKTDELGTFLNGVKSITNEVERLQRQTELLNKQMKFFTVSEVAGLMHLSLPAAREIFHRKDFPCCDYGKEMVVEKTAFINYFSKPVKKGEK